MTRGFPREELYGITMRIRRAAPSVPANITDGNDRENRREYIQFLRIAQVSLKELETHVTKIGLGRQGALSPGAARHPLPGKPGRGL